MSRFKISYSQVKGAPRGLDLFSGAGGLSLGFLMAGGLPTGSVDMDVDSIATFSSNFPMAKFNHSASIEDWRPSRLERRIDVVMGGPPCQGFSLARGTRFVDDPRNSLYKHFVRVVAEVQPKWMVMENVEGILSIGSGTILTQILEDFSEVGYELDYRVVNMAAYGVPQTRRRAIFVGRRSTTPFSWPDETHTKATNPQAPQLFEAKPPFVAINDALGDLNLTFGPYFAHRANSQMRGPRNRLADEQPAFTLRVRGDEFAICEHPATSAFIPQHRVAEPTSHTAPKNLFQEIMQLTPDWAPSDLRLVRRSSRKPVVGSRFLTVREQARLQSFPDWFTFTGNRVSQARQIGNAVPPLFAAHLFQAMFNL
jgi:DNA (cytosine-5)-methyltransferase 1